MDSTKLTIMVREIEPEKKFLTKIVIFGNYRFVIEPYSNRRGPTAVAKNG